MSYIQTATYIWNNTTSSSLNYLNLVTPNAINHSILLVCYALRHFALLHGLSGHLRPSQRIIPRYIPVEKVLVEHDTLNYELLSYALFIIWIFEYFLA